ncbi:unnamed protein product [Calypogeia fissa]
MISISQEAELGGGGGGTPGVPGVAASSSPSLLAEGRSGSSKRVRPDAAAEWSETAITALLDAFGERYIASHRGNLRGKDWADVTRAVNSAREGTAGGMKSVEQCRNKIDNLKKRFKLEREKGVPSAWQWFRTLDAIVGRAPKRAGIVPDHGGVGNGHPCDSSDVRLSLPAEPVLHLHALSTPSPPPLGLGPRPSVHTQNDSDPENVAETYSSQRDSHTDFPPSKGNGKDVTSEMTNPNPQEDVDIPSGSGKTINRKKRKNICHAGRDVAASIASFAEVFAKIEFAKMELYKEMELRRLDMQYKLAKLAHNGKKGSVSSSSDHEN